MRFIIYGAGGVGSVIGTELNRVGVSVTLVARGEHLAALKRDGLHYQTPHGNEQVRLDVVAHPRELQPQGDDIVLVTAKSQHTSVILSDLRETLGTQVPVICCQNGVANERMALRLFPKVYAMLVYLPAQLTEPGVVQCHAKRKSGVLDLSCFPTGTDALCEQVADALNSANFSVKPNPTVMRFKYAKLLMNLNNAIEAVLPDTEGRKALAESARAEGRACLQAAGIDCASPEEVRERRRDVFESGDIPGVARVGGSSRQSLLRGTGDIEADYLNGEIVMLGRLHGVPTPVNSLFQQLANELASKRLPPGSFSEDQIRAQLPDLSPTHD